MGKKITEQQKSICSDEIWHLSQKRLKLIILINILCVAKNIEIW